MNTDTIPKLAMTYVDIKAVHISILDSGIIGSKHNTINAIEEIDSHMDQQINLC